MPSDDYPLAEVICCGRGRPMRISSHPAVVLNGPTMSAVIVSHAVPFVCACGGIWTAAIMAHDITTGPVQLAKPQSKIVIPDVSGRGD